jgi:F0F1-type ATP synthase delta subunit
VLAYGQTGSTLLSYAGGKTYTMGTAVSTLADNARLGIIPRVISEIFDQIDQRSSSTVITVTASYIELYNEQIIDLLADPHYKKYTI